MRKLLTITCIISLLTACASFTKVQIQNTQLSAFLDDHFEPKQVKTTFSSQTPNIYLSLDITKPTQEQSLISRWYFLDTIVKNKRQDYLIDEGRISLHPNSKHIYFSISRPEHGWPKGNYRVDIIQPHLSKPLYSTNFFVL